MAGSVNKVMLLGNLGADPEVRTFQNGNRVCNLRVATAERWKDKNTGERQERTEWHNVSIFNDALVTIAEQYLRKGSKLFLEGKLETRKWQDQSGNDRYTTEVVIRPFNGSLTLLDPPPGSGQGGSRGSGYSQGGNQRGGQQGSQGGSPPGYGGGGGVDDLNDDIPF